MQFGSKQRQTWSNDQVAPHCCTAPTADARTTWQQLSGALAALAVLAALLPGPVRCLDVVRGRTPGFSPGAGSSSTGETAMLLLAALAVWTLLLWGSAVALVALTGRLPGRAGRAGRSMLARIAPGLARRLLLTAVGASMVTGLAACGTGPAAAASVPGNGPSLHMTHDGPRSSTARSTDGAVGRRGIPGQAMGWTSVEGSAVQLRSDLMDPRAGSEALPTGQMNIDWPTLPGRTASGDPTNPVDIDWPDPPAPVVVLAGDSLWSIAARHLPAGAGNAETERLTRQWYATNAAVIGGDPNLILPGQILQPPNQESSPRP